MDSNPLVEITLKTEEEIQVKTEMVDCGDEEISFKADPSLIKEELDPLTGASSFTINVGKCIAKKER